MRMQTQKRSCIKAKYEKSDEKLITDSKKDGK